MGQEEFQQEFQAIKSDFDEYRRQSLKRYYQAVETYFEEALEADDKNLYRSACMDLKFTQPSTEVFSETSFRLVLQTIKDSRFLKGQNSWTFLRVFDRRSKLSETQQAQWLETLIEIYDQFEGWMSCFTISESFEDWFSPAQAFEFFQRFEHSSNELARRFVPHGYEHALKNSTDGDLTAKLRGALIRLTEHEAADVSFEAQISLRRLFGRSFAP